MPVIQLMGLPGSGKSTLARNLLEYLGWSRGFRIGTYHKRFPATVDGDAAAWAAMRQEMEHCGWDRFVFETTGLNARWGEVMDRCGRSNVLTFKLECKLPELIRRISTKSDEDQAHGDWFPPHRFQNKIEFVQSMFLEFSGRRGDVILETTWAPPGEVFELVKRYLSAGKGLALKKSGAQESKRAKKHNLVLPGE